MEKINVYALTRPRRAAKTKTINTRGGPLTLTFWRLLTTDYTAARGVSDGLVEMYLGNPEEGIPPVVDSFFPVGDEASSIDTVLCNEAAQLAQAQPPDAPVRYTAEEFIALANGLDPLEWIEVKRFFKEMQAPPTEGSQGNGSGAATDN